MEVDSSRISVGLSDFLVLLSLVGTLLCAPPEFHSCGRYRAGPTTVWQLGLVMFQLFHTDVARFIPELLQEVVRSSPQSDGTMVLVLRVTFPLPPFQYLFICCQTARTSC